MSAALVAALVFTVALMVTHAYFLFGSVPLLVLKHDTPLDARFVRGFFNTYYLISFFTADATALSLAWAGRPTLALCAAGLALVAVLLRRTAIRKMDLLRAEVERNNTRVIPAFRRVHLAAILGNLAQLVFIVVMLISTSMQARAGV